MTYAARITALPLPTEAQVVAAARVLNKRAAEACNVDEEDSWKTYGDEYKDDAREALQAAAIAAEPDTELTALRARVGELERALTDLLASDRANQSEIVGRDVDGHPLNASGVARLQALAAINKEKL